MSLINQTKRIFGGEMAGFIQNEDILSRRSVINGGATAILAGSFVKYANQYTAGNPKEINQVVAASVTDTGLLFAIRSTGSSASFAQNDNLYVSNQVFVAAFATAGGTIAVGDKLMIGTGGKLVVWDEDAANTVVGIANQGASANEVFSFKRIQS